MILYIYRIWATMRVFEPANGILVLITLFNNEGLYSAAQKRRLASAFAARTDRILM